MARVTKTIQIEVNYEDKGDVDEAALAYVGHLLRIGKFHITESCREHYGRPSVGDPVLVEEDELPPLRTEILTRVR